MKITIVIGAFLPVPPAPCGAVEILWNDLAQEFARRGHEVTVVAREWPGQAREETVGGVRYVRRSGYSRTHKTGINLLKDLLYCVRVMFALPRADILVTNVFWLPVIAPLFRKSAGKVVVSVNRAPKGQFGWYKRVARLAAVSTAVADGVKEQCPEVAPLVKVLPNPIDTKVFVPPSGGRDYSGGAKRTILFTGRIHPEKGIHLLVEAFGKMRRRPGNLGLRFIGPSTVERGGGGAEYVEKLRQLSAGLDVEFLEPIQERAKLAAALQAAHYYCYPSLAEKGEALPVAPLEAMASGLPVIVSDLAVFRDSIADGVSGLVFNHRENAADNLARVLEKIVSDSEKARAIGEEANRVAQRFGNGSVAEMFLDDFKTIIASGEGTR